LRRYSLPIAVTTVPIQSVKKALAETVPWFTIGSIEFPDGVYRVIYKVELDVTDIDYLCYSVNVRGAQDLILQCKFDTTTVFTDTLGNGDRHYAQKDITAYSGIKTVLIQAYCNGGVNYVEDLIIWGQTA
jgi:hypothetical protein